MAEKELPKYKCHKEVHALKIARVEFPSGTSGANLQIIDQGFGPVWVDAHYVEKHKPFAGGYYVVYEDGYKSFSPAEAFEAGYTRL